MNTINELVRQIAQHIVAEALIKMHTNKATKIDSETLAEFAMERLDCADGICDQIGAAVHEHAEKACPVRAAATAPSPAPSPVQQQKRTTVATLKAFVRKHRARLLIKQSSSFDGMTDCVQHIDGATYVPAQDSERHESHTLGVHGLWLVGGGRDYIKPIDTPQYTGLSVSNSCGSCEVVIAKQ